LIGFCFLACSRFLTIIPIFHRLTHVDKIITPKPARSTAPHSLRLPPEAPAGHEKVGAGVQPQRSEDHSINEYLDKIAGQDKEKLTAR
jgi:hypothetical protein